MRSPPRCSATPTSPARRPVLAYAAAAAGTAPATDPDEPGRQRVADSGVPVPQPNPLRSVGRGRAGVGRAGSRIHGGRGLRTPARSALTLTKLDTQGLRLWIAVQSTREKRYALFTMPDFAQMPTLLDKPEVTFARALRPGDLSRHAHRPLRRLVDPAAGGGRPHHQRDPRRARGHPRGGRGLTPLIPAAGPVVGRPQFVATSKLERARHESAASFMASARSPA